MNRILLKYCFIVAIVIVMVLALASCITSPSAAGHIAGDATADPALVATAQADQYLRDAAATLDTRSITQQAVAFEIQATANAGTATAQTQQTRDALNIALTADSATIQAQETFTVATVQAESTGTEKARQDAGSTGTAVAIATTDAVKATRQAFELGQAHAEARRAQVITTVLSILLVVGAIIIVALGVLFFWKVIPILVNRLGLVRYGQHGNPLLLTSKNDRIIITDPMRMHQARAIY